MKINYRNYTITRNETSTDKPIEVHDDCGTFIYGYATLWDAQNSIDVHLDSGIRYVC